MMYNHLEDPNLSGEWETPLVDVSSVGIRSYGVYHRKNYIAKRDISAGQELFASYGNSNWFTDRGIPYNKSVTEPSEKYSLAELQQKGHCLTDIYTAESTIPMAGKGAFSSRNFAVGDLVSVTPTLMMPKHVVQSEGTWSLLFNYVISHSQSDVAVLPISRISLCNHASAGRNNVEVRWVRNLQGDILTDLSVFSDPNFIVGRKSSPVYLGYFATRPIQAGEELTVSYGEEWETEWNQYLDLLEHWLRAHDTSQTVTDENVLLSTAPQFRHYLVAPEGLFPPSFFEKDCVGKDCLKQRTAYHNKIQKTRSPVSRKEGITDDGLQDHARLLSLSEIKSSRQLLLQWRRPISLLESVLIEFRNIFTAFMTRWN